MGLKLIPNNDGGFNGIEILIVASLVITCIFGGLIWFLDVEKGIRDSVRKIDIGIIAGSLEIHHNVKANEFCQNAEPNSYCHPEYPWFQGGVPVDPLRGDYINLPQDGDKQFLICAKLERGGGNSASTDGTPSSKGTAMYYCQKNQQ